MVNLEPAAGFSLALGGFMAGAILSRTELAEEIESLTTPLRDFFSALFFVAVGTLINPADIVRYWHVIGLLSFLVIAGKFLSCRTGFALTGVPPQIASRAAFAKAQIGEFSFIIAALALSLGLTNPALKALASGVAMVTILLTPAARSAAEWVNAVAGKRMPSGLRRGLAHYQRWFETVRMALKSSRFLQTARRPTANVVVHFILLNAVILLASLAATRISATEGRNFQRLVWPVAALPRVSLQAPGGAPLFLPIADSGSEKPGVNKLALLSVSDKRGLVEFASSLVQRHGYRLLSTGGTARLLRDAGLPVTDVGEHTGFPEIMDGRVKTLHPKVHGGLLCRRDSQVHLAQAREHGIAMIDLVVVNLYPFEATIARPEVAREEAIENIDIGGPSMLRSAAKNHEFVTVVTDPGDYARVLAVLGEANSGEALKGLRRELALKVFRRTSAYDRTIAEYLAGPGAAERPDMDALSGFPAELSATWKRASVLRYGENPHQKAALYGSFFDHYEQLQGKELSYNNILDITAATYLIGEFQKPTVAILKHTNPCGVASASSLREAWDLAYATDRQAPFGGIIVVNHTLDEDLAQEIREIFTEVIIAPRFSDRACEVFARKKNLRLMVAREGLRMDALKEMRSVVGGVLYQDRDCAPADPSRFRVVTKREPTAAEMESMLFGWRVVRHVKSNAIVYTRGERTLGIGAGQMARVDSSKIAVWKAGEAGLDLRGSVVVSEALFPFADGLVAAAEAGATAAIQPGGSVRDAEVIAAADERDMAMVFTGVRHFKH